MRFVLRMLFVLLAMGLLSMSVEAQKPPPTKQQVNALIQKLDSDSFDEREQATAKLKRLGKRIVPYLLAARKKPKSLEMRYRLDMLLSFHPLGPTAVLRGHTDVIMGVDFAPNGSRLVSVSRDGIVSNRKFLF